MGRRNLNTMLRYSHLAEFDLKAAILGLDRFAEIGPPSDTSPSSEAAVSGAQSSSVLE